MVRQRAQNQVLATPQVQQPTQQVQAPEAQIQMPQAQQVQPAQVTPQTAQQPTQQQAQQQPIQENPNQAQEQARQEAQRRQQEQEQRAQQERERQEQEQRAREQAIKMQQEAIERFGIPHSDYSGKTFIEYASRLFKLEIYSKALRENTGNLSALEKLLEIEAPYFIGNTQELTEPKIALGFAGMFAKEGNKRMIAYTRKNLTDMLNDLSDEHVTNLAMTLPKEAEHYMAIERALAEGKVKEARAAYAKVHDDKIWREYVTGLGNLGIQVYAHFYARIAKEKTIVENFGKRKKDKNGREVIEKDAERAREYIAKKVQELDDSDKKERAKKEELYSAVARLLYAQKANGEAKINQTSPELSYAALKEDEEELQNAGYGRMPMRLRNQSPSYSALNEEALGMAA